MGLIQKNSDSFLGTEINQQGAIPFESLSVAEQTERIKNYIIKKYNGKKTIEELTQECKLEYNTINGCLNDKKDGKYTLNTNLLQSDYIALNGIRLDLTKDAAALCQLTYACDPNRAGDNLYHTFSQNWIPYIPQSNKNILSKRMQDFFSNFENDKRLNTTMDNYTLKEKWEFGTFKSIFLGDIDLLKEFDKRISRKRTGFFLCYIIVTMGIIT